MDKLMEASMNTKINKLLAEKGDNYIFPFFWQHGEDEQKLREYMKVIHESNIGAVCVESRPHPDFCGPKWWKDMDIILDEARKRKMKVWILDDAHFPSGYANGAALNAPIERRRQGLCFREFNVEEGTSVFNLHIKENMVVIRDGLYEFTDMYNKNNQQGCQFDDDELVSITAAKYDENGKLGDLLDLSSYVKNDELTWESPKGNWKVFLCFLSRNVGSHRSYINMMDKESCKILLNAVYEPHFERYAEDFGTTIAGFFSDEPELGNGAMYRSENVLGTDQDLPWSNALSQALEKSLGDNWKIEIPLLWNNDFPDESKAKVRYTYMDKVTRLVEECFSNQLGNWCSEHGVEYIGHLIEDNNQHARTGSSLGHFFRGLSGQHMSGIDNIGGQVLPQGEDLELKGHFGETRDGEFFHYALGKLGSSYAAIDPKKQGKTMCEIFGNYGWGAGVRLEKYLADHFMVRSVNRFVPHAFSPKPYPDPDCPPHFYANGHNPQYRHFGALMKYMNRICELISDGKGTEKIAILYHAEAEWAGKCMLMQKPARIMAENQIDFHFVPIDVFEETDRYGTKLGKLLQINEKDYEVLIIPYMQFIPKILSDAISTLVNNGSKVIFLESLPEGICDIKEELSVQVTSCETVPLESLLDRLEELNLREILVYPEAKKLRVLHYKNENSIYYFVNESDKTYTGKVKISQKGQAYSYDAWNNVLLKQDYSETEEGMDLEIVLAPSESRIIVIAEVDENVLQLPIITDGEKISLNKGWKRSICRSIEYPNFKEEKEIQEFKSLAEDKPEFSGYIRYENEFESRNDASAVLEITDAYEGVEVFINNNSAGIQILPPFVYNLTPLVKQGKNLLRIEVATTLERENANSEEELKEMKPTGIIGEVNLYLKKIKNS
jgi:hypothetical protein